VSQTPLRHMLESRLRRLGFRPDPRAPRSDWSDGSGVTAAFFARSLMVACDIGGRLHFHSVPYDAADQARAAALLEAAVKKWRKGEPS
jgi:hypothetical protein